MNPTALAFLLLAASSATLASAAGSDSGSDSGLGIPSVSLAACSYDHLAVGHSSDSGFIVQDQRPFRILGEAPSCPLGDPPAEDALAEAVGSDSSDSEPFTGGTCNSLLNDANGEVLGVFRRFGCASIRLLGYVDLLSGVVTPFSTLPVYTAAAVIDRDHRLLALTGNQGPSTRTLYHVLGNDNFSPICRIPNNGGVRMSFVNGEVYVSTQGTFGPTVLHVDVDASMASGDATADCVTTELSVTGNVLVPLHVVQQDGVTFFTDRQSFGYVSASGPPDSIPDALTFIPLGEAVASDGLALTQAPDGSNGGSESGSGSEGGSGSGSGSDGDDDSDVGTCSDLVPETFYYLGRFITSRPTGTVGPFIDGVQYYEVENADSYTPREDCAGL